jgi:hypothetical protein
VAMGDWVWKGGGKVDWWGSNSDGLWHDALTVCVSGGDGKGARKPGCSWAGAHGLTLAEPWPAP